MSGSVLNMILGSVRGNSRPNYAEGDARLGLNNGGEQLISQSQLPKTELTRLGNSFNCTIPTASAFTNVAGMPTTRAELALYNGDPVKSYIIDQVWFLSLTSITAAAGVSLIWQLGFPAVLTDNTAVLINSPLGKVYNGKAKRALAVTTMVANQWAMLASTPAGAAASIGLGIVANVDGGIIVPPGATLGLNAVVGTATGTSLIGLSWHEAVLNLAL
jgi:hypothetical protein